MALWDLAGRAGIRRAPDRRVRDRVAVGVSLGTSRPSKRSSSLSSGTSPPDTAESGAIEPGGMDVVSAVRRRFPAIDLTVDANAAYTPEDAGVLSALDDFSLDYIEQPLGHEDLWGHAALARRLRTPICLDESIRSAADAAVAAAIGAARIVNSKIGRVGGLAEARRIHDVCAGAGIPVWCGGMLERGSGPRGNPIWRPFNFTGPETPPRRPFDRYIVDPPSRRSTERCPSPPARIASRWFARVEYTISRAEFAA
jgi:O-succinylbenzoate synthase